MSVARPVGSDVSARVKEAVISALHLDIDPSELPEDGLLFGEGPGADSLATLEIVAAIEAAFGFEVEDEDLRAELFQSIGSLTQYVEHRLAAARV
jgi:acyl carrier protein